MRIAEGVEWAAHACAVLASLPAGQALNAAALASFHELPPAYMAKHLQALSKAGVVVAVRGAQGGYALARPASQITLWDVQAAISGSEPSFRCQDIRRKGPCAGHYPSGAPCPIACAFAAAEQAYRDHLKSVPLSELVRQVAAGMGPAGRDAFRSWAGLRHTSAISS
ncbi:MAG TPA: Rrf2 family transcriptional regulator [Caulobacteraceae bacterium]|jgi:Rrf2 family protein|nr:Rrf2 family transcriptional regulator [Caulobacteraceae bacterium]